MALQELDKQGKGKLAEVLENSLNEGTIPTDWLDSHLAPIPNEG